MKNSVETSNLPALLVHSSPSSIPSALSGIGVTKDEIFSQNFVIDTNFLNRTGLNIDDEFRAQRWDQLRSILEELPEDHPSTSKIIGFLKSVTLSQSSIGELSVETLNWCQGFDTNASNISKAEAFYRVAAAAFLKNDNLTHNMRKMVLTEIESDLRTFCKNRQHYSKDALEKASAALKDFFTKNPILAYPAAYPVQDNLLYERYYHFGQFYLPNGNGWFKDAFTLIDDHDFKMNIWNQLYEIIERQVKDRLVTNSDWTLLEVFGDCITPDQCYDLAVANPMKLYAIAEGVTLGKMPLKQLSESFAQSSDAHNLEIYLQFLFAISEKQLSALSSEERTHFFQTRLTCWFLFLKDGDFLEDWVIFILRMTLQEKGLFMGKLYSEQFVEFDYSEFLFKQSREKDSLALKQCQIREIFSVVPQENQERFLEEFFYYGTSEHLTMMQIGRNVTDAEKKEMNRHLLNALEALPFSDSRKQELVKHIAQLP